MDSVLTPLSIPLLALNMSLRVPCNLFEKPTRFYFHKNTKNIKRKKVKLFNMKWDKDTKIELLIFLVFYWVLRVGFGYPAIWAFPLAFIGVVGYRMMSGKKEEKD